MQSYLLEEHPDIEKREEPRRKCSVYVNFTSGHYLATARIVDYSDSGFRMQAWGQSYLGPTIEIIDAEFTPFSLSCGRVVWQRLLEDDVREFGVHLTPEPEAPTPYKASDCFWLNLQQLAIEEAFA